jgi:hypothetical protein
LTSWVERVLRAYPKTSIIVRGRYRAGLGG